MPFEIVKDSKKGYFVIDTNGKKYSKKPLPLARAKRQLAALNIHIRRNLEGGIAVKLDKYADGTYGVSDMSGKVLDHGLTKKQALIELTKWYKQIPTPTAIPAPTPNPAPAAPAAPAAVIGSEQSAFRKVKKGGITNERFINFLKDLKGITKHDPNDHWLVDSTGRIQFQGNFMEPLMAAIQAYFSPSEYEQINNSQLKQNIIRLLAVTHINEFIKLVRELYPGKFEGPIRAFIHDVESKKLIDEQIDKVQELLHIVITNLLRELVEEYAQDRVDLSKYKKEFKASGKRTKRGGMTPEEQEKLTIEHNNNVKEAERLQHLSKTRDIMNRAMFERDPEFKTTKRKYLENVISAIQYLIRSSHLLLRNGEIKYLLGTYTKDQYEARINNTRDATGLLEQDMAEAKQELEALGGQGKPKKKGGMTKGSVSGNPKEEVKMTTNPLSSEIQYYRLGPDGSFSQATRLPGPPPQYSEPPPEQPRPLNLLEQASDCISDMLCIPQNDPYIAPRFRARLGKGKYSDNELSGNGYYQDELQRRMQRFPEHIANPIIQSHLPLLEAIGPSRSNILKGRLFGNPERQQRKENIINHAIAEAQAATEKRKRRRLPIGSTYITSMDDIATGDEVIDYANNSRSQIYHSPADWEAWRLRRAELRQPFNDPYSSAIVNPRNIERFTAEILPEEVAYNKYREGSDTWYQAIDDKGNPIGKPSWTKPPIETGQKYRPRAPTIELSKPDTYVVPEPAAAPIPIAPIATHPAPFDKPVPIAYPLPIAQQFPVAPIAQHPAPFANIVATPNPLFRKRTPNPLFQPYTASGKFSESDILIGDKKVTGGVIGIVGNAADFMIDEYNKARMANPSLPPIEEIDQFLTRNDLLWIRNTLNLYKTWDNYLSRAKGSLELEIPDNLQNFLIKRNAFITNMPKMKYYLEHINRILPPGKKEKSLLELSIEAEARGELEDRAKKPGGSGKVKFVKKYLKGQGLPTTKQNVDKVCDIMNTEGIVFEGNK
jgi:hypothetical protein